MLEVPLPYNVRDIYSSASEITYGSMGLCWCIALILILLATGKSLSLFRLLKRCTPHLGCKQVNHIPSASLYDQRKENLPSCKSMKIQTRFAFDGQSCNYEVSLFLLIYLTSLLVVSLR